MVSGIDSLREALPRPLKSGVKSLIRLPDRFLHPRRRRRARRKLGEVSPDVRSVTFVCHGNICRSPFAERVFARSLPDQVRRDLRIESTGFYPEEGRHSPDDAVAAAGRHGVDLTDHRSRSLSDVGNFTSRGPGRRTRDPLEHDLVFVMEPDQRGLLRRGFETSPFGVLVLGDFDPEPVERRAIRDPYGQSQSVFDRVFDRIERCASEAAAVFDRRFVNRRHGERR